MSIEKQILIRLDKILKILEQGEWISEKNAADLMGISVKTLQNRVYSKSIGKEYYTTAINGARVYNKQKLLNLN